MTITDNQKIDYLFKKIGYGATKTDTNSQKLAPNEAIPSPLLIRGDRVWKQAGSIPGVKPGSSSGVVTCYVGASAIETTADNTATANRTWKTGVTDWIPPQFGSTYLVNVYVHTSGDAANAASISNKVFVTGSGNDDEWFFDYESGVLNFIGTNLPNGVNFSGKSVYIEGARYTGEFGVGGDTGAYTFTDNRIQTTTTNEEIIIEPAGTGYVAIDANTGLIVPTGTTAERPTGQVGMIRFNSTTSLMEVYNGSGWVNIGGSTVTLDEFDGDNSTVAFSLSQTASATSVLVSINGTVQEVTNSYSVSGTTLTFTNAPASGDKIQVRNFFSGNTVDVAKLQDADGDTKIQVEESSDEDVIRFDTAGSERLSINASGLTVTGTLNTHTIPSGTGTFALKKTPQIVTSTTARNTTNSSFQDVAGYTASLTTTEANSKLRVSVNVTRSGDAGKIKLVRTIGGSSTDIIEIPFISGDGNFTVSYIDSPSQSASTSVTYKLQHATNGSGTVYVNYTTTNNQIAIEEL